MSSSQNGNHPLQTLLPLSPQLPTRLHHRHMIQLHTFSFPNLTPRNDADTAIKDAMESYHIDEPPENLLATVKL